jgi:linoleoyl-CoA desaturase
MPAALATSRVRFDTASAFHRDLKRAVDGHFERTGRSPRGGPRMWAKTAVMLGWTGASWALLVFSDAGPVARLLLAASLGLAMAGVGFSVMHDANHGSYAEGRRANRIVGFALDLIGGSSWLWRHKHNVLHHTYTNVAGLDTDLGGNAFLRFAADQPRRPMQRYQHLYVWAFYAIYPLGWWLVDDFHRLATGRIGGNPLPRPRGAELAALFAGKAVFFSWAFAIPALVHPTWAALPFGLVAVATLGVTLALVFQLAHCVAEADFHAGAPGAAQDWAAHQVATTVDFARGNLLLGWYLGGLNFQVEHHLFPKVCHVHYRALAPLVEQTCAAHGVRYRAQPTLRAAVAANVRWLRTLGRGEEPGAALAACGLRAPGRQRAGSPSVTSRA